MIQLPNITLLAVATQSVESTVKALEYSCREITFGKVKLVSPYRPQNLPDYIEHEYINPFATIDDWNYHIAYNLWTHFDTEFCFLAHADGFIVNPQSWKEEFLQYDYIGSPWSYECALAIQGGRDQPLSRVGNSVSIRSHRLCKLPVDAKIEWSRFNNDSNEDTWITCHRRKTFEACGMKFAPLELAIQFGREEDIPECQHITEPFCFHKWSGRNHIYPHF